MVSPLIATMIRVSGRSWWQVRYYGGHVLSEWDTLTDAIRLPIGLGRSSRWEEIPKHGMVAVRLLCPNGMAAEVEAPSGTEGRFFQLKVGGFDIAGTPGRPSLRRYCDAHIIGAVLDDNGKCFCRAWETKEKRLTEFYDNIYNMKYRNIGPLNLEVQQLKI